MSERMMEEKISTEELRTLRRKAKLFDHFVASEQLTKEELKQIRAALRKQPLSEDEFRARHPELA